ncbi:30S ribosomal protein S13, partial [bacterium]
MARIAGVDLPRHKHVAFSLPYLYGVGHALARTICAEAGIDPTKKTEELTEGEIRKIRELLET